MATGTFRLPISAGAATPPVGEWTKPADWPDISDVANNEINLLVSDAGLATVAFKVIVTGGYTVNWGDGTVTNYASDALAQHTYTVGAGAPCSRGYTTFKIRIYAQTPANAITRFYVQQHTNPSTKQVQRPPIHWAYFGTSGLISIASLFYSAFGIICDLLESVEFAVDNLDAVLDGSYAIYATQSMRKIALPNSMNSCANLNYFAYSSRLAWLHLPEFMDALQSAQRLAGNNPCLLQFSMPGQYNALADGSYLLYASYSLAGATLPKAPNLTNASTALQYCCIVKSLLNLDQFGSTTTGVDMTAGFDYLEWMPALSISAKLSKFSAHGGNGYSNKTTSIRLTNATSPFGGSSPQIDISYNSLNATALNTLFGDLPTLTGKTINITSNPGAATCDRTIATAKGWTVTG